MIAKDIEQHRKIMYSVLGDVYEKAWYHIFSHHAFNFLLICACFFIINSKVLISNLKIKDIVLNFDILDWFFCYWPHLDFILFKIEDISVEMCNMVFFHFMTERQILGHRKYHESICSWKITSQILQRFKLS